MNTPMVTQCLRALVVRPTALEDKGPVSGPEVGGAVVSLAGVTGGQTVVGIAGEHCQGSGRKAAKPSCASERGRVAVFDRWEAVPCSVNVLSACLKGNSMSVVPALLKNQQFTPIMRLTTENTFTFFPYVFLLSATFEKSLPCVYAHGFMTTFFQQRTV